MIQLKQQSSVKTYLKIHINKQEIKWTEYLAHEIRN